MADTLDEPWWDTSEGANLSPALSDNEEECANTSETIQQTSSSTFVSSKKRKKPTECFISVEREKSKDEKEIKMKPKRKRRKKISDLLTETVPKPGVPADVQKMLNQHFGAKRSVIELEELKLPDSCFLPANDLTHSFSSYLKETPQNVNGEAIREVCKLRQLPLDFGSWLKELPAEGS